jgi:hypothetical protein
VIDLYNDAIGDATIAVLARLPNLRVLDAGRTHTTDAGVAHLAGNTSLRELALQRTAISDAAMKTIGGLRGLQCLRLSEIESITAAGFAEVLQIDDLRALYISTPPDSDEVEALLRKRFPELWFDC